MTAHVRLHAPGVLAATALLSLGIAGPASASATAADPAATVAVACGQPAVPATYTTIEHPEVTETIPAVTHLEWRWARTVQQEQTEYGIETSPEYEVLAWSRTTSVTEREYVRTVVDQEAVPAVPGTPEVGHWETRVVRPALLLTEWEYEQLQTGNLRWEEEGWNAGAGGRGWEPTGNTRDVVLVPEETEQVWVVDQPAVPEVPAVPEISHQELFWLVDGATVPAGATPTGQVSVESDTDTVELPKGQSPAGDGWVLGAVVRTVAAVVDLVWVGSGEPAPDGYAATGRTRSLPPTEETSDLRATQPDGDGWQRVDGSETVVVDQPEETLVVEDAWTETVELTAAVPATAPCVDGGATTDPGSDDTDTDADSDSDTDADSDAVSDDVDAPSGGQATAGGVLPATGSDVSPWLGLLGGGSLAAGLVLVRRGRRTA